MPDRERSRQLYRNARREAFVVTIVWAVGLVWTVGVCYVMGYEHAENDLVVRLGLASAGKPNPSIILGFPDWVFWGIMLPWVLISVFTVWFGMSWMADDELGADNTDHGGESHGH